MSHVNPRVMTLMLLMLVAGCQPARQTSLVTLPSLQELSEKYHISMQWDDVSQVVTLRGAGLEAKGLVGSEVVMLAEERIYLSSPIEQQRGKILVPNDFQQKVISRMLNVVERPLSIHKFSRIVVDAGHGGKDPGTIGRTSGIQEKEVVLDISRRLKKALQGRGFEVVMTRERDEFISLAKRTEIASKARADLFISIHANSNPQSSIQGMEIYTHRILGYQDKKEDQRQTNQQLLFKGLSMKQGDAALERTLSDMLYRFKEEETEPLASHVARSMAYSTKVKNRGVKSSGFFVLRNTLIPAVLIEVGYLSNSKEERLLRSDDYRQKLADGLAESIAHYSNL
jgi:N-acetylmuramoyl-L-alanine amidase